MKSVKPGRGPSMLEGIGSLLAGAFGVIWMVVAKSMGAPLFFALFGLVFVILAIVRAAYSFYNAGGKNRYSEFDIVDEGEEPDPFAPQGEERREPAGGLQGDFCPYCGARAEEGYRFCRKCGKELPRD